MGDLTGGLLYIVDEISGFNPPRIQNIDTNYFYLGAYAVAVLYPFI